MKDFSLNTNDCNHFYLTATSVYSILWQLFFKENFEKYTSMGRLTTLNAKVYELIESEKKLKKEIKKKC